MTDQPVVVSAPGKVLFAGGFLVLDRAHTGLVFGLNARIHVHVQAAEPVDQITPALSIAVHSPQFKNARWMYKWIGTEGSWTGAKCQLQQATTPGYDASDDNPFVKTALEYALVYMTSLGSRLQGPPSFAAPLRITILADDSYYSSSPSGDRSGEFKKFGVALREAHKTGLGSSAALVTALTAALIVYMGRSTPSANLSNPTVQKRVHNIAQAAHCAAQGKVGSGFDVAAAVYGSCLYRRFSPNLLSNLGNSQSPEFGDRLRRCVEDLNLEQPWDVEISSKTVGIPKSLLLLMCDVDCGSETPGMVKKVLAWRKEKPEEARMLWTELQYGTEELCRNLRSLAKNDNGLTMHEQNSLGDTILTIRAMVRSMSQKSQVPIEPPVITELLDFCTGLPGVVGGVAPGAGGYDAVALLVRNDVDVVRDLEERLKSWTTTSEGTNGATIGKVSLLKVKQGHDGVRVEDVKNYESWVRL